MPALQAEIQAALESNVMLEMDEASEPEPAPEPAVDEQTPSATAEELEVEYAEISTLGQSSGAPLPEDLRDRFDFPDKSGDTLQDHLLWQLEMDQFSDVERQIGRTLIDAINEDGYLTATVESTGFSPRAARVNSTPSRPTRSSAS